MIQIGLILAIKIFKDIMQVGYIKIIHSTVFYKSKIAFSLVVKAIEENGVVNRVFVKVYA